MLALVPIALIAAAFARPAPSSDVGAPWISLELPANPLDRAHADAVLIVRTYYHETPAAWNLRGTAEGMVNGKRRSIPLEFESTSGTGVWAVRQAWPSEGEWVLIIGLAEGGTTLIAELGPDGGVRNGRYHESRTRTLEARAIEVTPERPATARIDARLQALAVAAAE
jgi:hypothetical protein